MSIEASFVRIFARLLESSECIGCRSEIDQLGGTSVLRFDNVIWN